MKERKNRGKRISIPIEVIALEDNSYHILIPAVINGIGGDLILDTGASVTIVDQNLFQAFLTTTDAVRIQSGSVSGSINDVQLIRTESFEIGGSWLTEVNIAAIDLDYVNGMYEKHAGRKIIGLLGCDFCLRYLATISYRNRRFSFKIPD